MAGPHLVRDREIFAQLETVYGTSPGALAAGDAFKHLAGTDLSRVIARYDRNRDRDRRRASVITTHIGRQSSKWNIPCDLIPSNNSATPTAPDVDQFLEAHIGSKRTATAHTTLAVGSTTTVLNFATGGGAASGVQVGDIIMVDVSATFRMEARQVTVVAGDVVTVDRALSAAPAAAREVKLGTTYTLSEQALKSLHLWEFLDGDNHRYSAGGCIVQDLGIDVDYASDTPVAGVTFSGVGGRKVAASTARPTPTTAGIPLVPSEGKVWIGTTLTRPTKFSLKSNNGLELRQNTSGSLYPTGAKRTGNESRYKAEMMLDILLETGTIEGYHTNEDALTAYDVIVQLGVTTGMTVVVRAPKWIPEAPHGDIDGEVSLAMSGALYGTSGDDEYKLAFL